MQQRRKDPAEYHSQEIFCRSSDTKCGNSIRPGFFWRSQPCYLEKQVILDKGAV